MGYRTHVTNTSLPSLRYYAAVDILYRITTPWSMFAISRNSTPWPILWRGSDVTGKWHFSNSIKSVLDALHLGIFVIESQEGRVVTAKQSGRGHVGRFNHPPEKSATPQIYQQAEGRGAVEREWVVTYHTRNPLNDWQCLRAGRWRARWSPGDADPGCKANTFCIDRVFISSQLWGLHNKTATMIRVFTRDGNYAVYRRLEQRSAPRRYLHASRPEVACSQKAGFCLFTWHCPPWLLGFWSSQNKKKRYKCLSILKVLNYSHTAL